MKLYLIHAYDVNGDSLDQFVRAINPADAVNLWLLSGLGYGADLPEDHDLVRVQEVPAAPQRGVVKWNDVVEHGLEYERFEP